ncbi:MAG: AbrB family transcriptional regulator [Rhodobacterales bacterium]|nr:AbrB family transcriptional regulator [Rhodobacterales bacterium]
MASVLLALAIGAGGGLLFNLLTIPLPWMTGAMCATTAAAMLGLPIRAWMPLRTVMVGVLGIMLGSAFTPDTLGRATAWWGSLIPLLLYSLGIAVVIFALLRRLAGFGPVTAYFSAAPGGLSEMIVVGSAMGGDDRTISLMHTVRIMVTVLLIPLYFRLFEGFVPTGMSRMGRVEDIAGLDALLLVACALVGYPLARRLRIPAAAMVGPMVVSAGLHLAGATAARPPGEIVALAQVVLGATIGCRFVDVPLKRVFGILMLGAGTTLIMLVIAFACAQAVQAVTGLPFTHVLLAFSPGGLPEMSLISLAMNADPAFVATHHLVRIVFVIMVFPSLFRLFAGRAGGGDGTSEKL